MDDAYIGSLVMFAGNFAPRNWAFCDGQILPISSNQALFSILGTTYGGDGRTTFALPDLRGRYPIHPGTGTGLRTRRLGERSGQEDVTLLETQMPSHKHSGAGALKAKEEGDADDPSGHFIAGTGALAFGTTSDIQMNDSAVDLSIENTGGSQSHNNMPPYLGINYIICIDGLFPPRH